MKEKSETHLKIMSLKERYKKLYNQTSSKEPSKPKELSKKDEEILKSCLGIIKKSYFFMKFQSGLDKRDSVYKITKAVDALKIREIPLTIEDANTLCTILISEDFRNLAMSSNDNIYQHIGEARMIAFSRLRSALNFAMGNTEDIEELKQLLIIIEQKSDAEEAGILESTRHNIKNKILSIKEKSGIDKFYNNIPEQISEIITALVQGEINIEHAISTIKALAQQRVESKPKTNFSLDENGEQTQILYQIANVIQNKYGEYSIEDSENAKVVIERLQLLGMEKSRAVTVVVRNLLGNGKSAEAKKVCEQERIKDKYTMKITNQLDNLKDEILYYETSEYVSKYLKDPEIGSRQIVFFSVLEKQIASGKIDMFRISLGKNKDGTRDITLKDIWDSERPNKNK